MRNRRCLEELGVNIGATADTVARCVSEAGIGFCFAPTFHPAFRFAGPPRREIGIPTAFNLLGPMANPGRVQRQVIGVADPSRAELVLGTLRQRGAKHVWVCTETDLMNCRPPGLRLSTNLSMTRSTPSRSMRQSWGSHRQPRRPHWRRTSRKRRVVRNVLSGAPGASRHRRTQRSCCARRRW